MSAPKAMASSVLRDERVVKVGLERGHRTLRVTSTMTFADLTDKLLEKLKTPKHMAMFFQIILKRERDNGTWRKELIPHRDDYVLEILEREENVRLGEVTLALSDLLAISAPWKRRHKKVKALQPHEMLPPDLLEMFKPSPLCTETFDPTFSLTAHPTQPGAAQEFPDSLSLHEALFRDIEKNCLKFGRLDKHIRSKDAYKEYWCALDEHHLWLSRSNENDCVFIPINLDNDSKAEVVDERAFSFSVQGTTIMSREILRANSETELHSWVDTINNRRSCVSENELFVIAESHIADESIYASYDDVRVMCQCASFEGMIMNHFMRDCFQTFLQAEHSDELFRFWQHAEDFRLNHPLSPRNRETNTATAENVESEAVDVFQSFISDDALHQVSVSAEDVEFIEKSLAAPPHDLFAGPQRAAYTQLRTSSFTRFVQQSKYRKLVLQLPYHSRKILRSIASSTQGKTNDLQLQRTTSTPSPVRESFFGALRMTSESKSPVVILRKPKESPEEIFLKSRIDSGTKQTKGPPKWKPYSFWTKVTIDEVFDDSLLTKIYPSSCPMEMGKTIELVERMWRLYPSGGSQDTTSDCNTADSIAVRNLREQHFLLLGEKHVLPDSGQHLPPTIIRTPKRLQVSEVLLKGHVVHHSWVRVFYCKTDVRSLSGTLRPASTPVRPRAFSVEVLPVLSDSDSSAPALSPTLANLPNWERLFCVVTEFQGRGEMQLWLPQRPSPSTRIQLACVTLLQPAEKVLHCLEIHDVEGLTWLVQPEAIDEDNTSIVCRTWLDVLAPYCHPRSKVVRILQEGPVFKKGQLNTAFKKRWMILTSTHTLRYFKEDNGAFKGEVPVSSIIEVNTSSGKDFNIITRERHWIFVADSPEEAIQWVTVLSTIVNERNRAAAEKQEVGA